MPNISIFYILANLQKAFFQLLSSTIHSEITILDNINEDIQITFEYKEWK